MGEDVEKSETLDLEGAFALARSHGFQLTSLIEEMEKMNNKVRPESKKQLSKRLSRALSASMRDIDVNSTIPTPTNEKLQSIDSSTNIDIEANSSISLPRNVER